MDPAESSFDSPNTFPVSSGDLIEISGERAFAPGTRISDNIELVRLLGTGGMGDVWLAEHAALQTQVAVKFMSKEVLREPALVARFSREARLSARIKSPHVVQIFDFATSADATPYIVMELLEGQDLASRISRGRAMDMEGASRVIVQVCKALTKAHALGIVHRDIKPENVFLVDNDGEMLVKLLDFGIAKDQIIETEITLSGTTMATASYMSPEQVLESSDVDFRADLWSTAVLAYRCLTGRLPFEGSTFGSVCIAIHAGKFVPPSQLSDKIPPGLDAWFARAFERSPQDRFASASEMADAYLTELDRAGLLPVWAMPRSSMGDIKTYASDPGGIGGALITLRSRTSGRWKRSPWASSAVAAALAAAVAVTGVVTGHRLRAAQAAIGPIAANASQEGAALLFAASPLNPAVELTSQRDLDFSPFVPASAASLAIEEPTHPSDVPGVRQTTAPVRVSVASVRESEPSAPSIPTDPQPEPKKDAVPETLVYGF